MRYLIVNADDFGRSPDINRGVITAHERGIVTSASLMVRWPAAQEAAEYARSRPSFGLGLHLDLGEWVHKGGLWTEVYKVTARKRASIEGEVERQLSVFRELVGRPPTHLDSHQHVHRREPVRSILAESGRALDVPVREVTPEVRYCGAFYGQTRDGGPLPGAVGVESLLKIIAELPQGVTELGCHPADGRDFESSYLLPRAEELRTLCDPAVARALAAEGVLLASFADLPEIVASAQTSGR
jgi:chitin disaccharide deacetylase